MAIILEHSIKVDGETVSFVGSKKVPTITLNPGINEVTDEQYRILRKLSSFRAMFKASTKGTKLSWVKVTEVTVESNEEGTDISDDADIS